MHTWNILKICIFGKYFRRKLLGFEKAKEKMLIFIWLWLVFKKSRQSYPKICPRIFMELYIFRYKSILFIILHVKILRWYYREMNILWDNSHCMPNFLYEIFHIKYFYNSVVHSLNFCFLYRITKRIYIITYRSI